MTKAGIVAKMAEDSGIRACSSGKSNDFKCSNTLNRFQQASNAILFFFVAFSRTLAA